MAATQRTDWFMFLIAAGLALFGAMMVYSASAMMSMKESAENSQFTYFFKQLIFVLIGIAAMLIVSRLDYRVFNNKYAIVGILALTSIALIAVLAFLLSMEHDAGSDSADFRFSRPNSRKSLCRCFWRGF